MFFGFVEKINTLNSVFCVQFEVKDAVFSF